MRIYYAYEIVCKDRAGLALCGQDDDGDLEWVGTQAKWAQAEHLESYYEKGQTPPPDDVDDYTGAGDYFEER